MRSCNIHNGLPSGVQNSVIAFANVIVQSHINSFGKLAMVAYGTHAKIKGFAFLPITSFNMASTTFISQNLGAKQYDRAKKRTRFSILAAVLLAFSHSVAAVCRGAGKAFVPMCVMLAIWCALRITYIVIVIRLTHETGIFTGLIR